MMPKDESGARVEPPAEVNHLKRRLAEQNRTHGASSAPMLKKQATGEKKASAPDAAPAAPVAPVNVLRPDEMVHDVDAFDRLSSPFNKWMTHETRSKLRGNVVMVAAVTSVATAGVTAGASVIGFFGGALGLPILIGLIKGYKDLGPAVAKHEALRKTFLKNFYTLPEAAVGAKEKGADDERKPDSSVSVESEGPPILRYRPGAASRALEKKSEEKAEGSPVLRQKEARSEGDKEGAAPSR